MSLKLVIGLLAATAAHSAVVNIENVKKPEMIPGDCECYTKSERQATWEFLSALSKKMEEMPELAATAGVLSPLVGCDCEEKNRTKRKIMPDSKEAGPEFISEYDSALTENKRVRFNDRYCPKNYARVGLHCIREELLE